MGKEELKVCELSWNPNKEQEPILKNVTEEFQSGKFYGIIGPNGSGKTSFVRHILHLLSIEKNKIFLNESDLTKLSRKELAAQLAFVPQNSYLDVDFYVYDMIAMGRLPYQRRFSELTKHDKDLIENAMEITNCQNLRNKKFRTLSGGEAQRVLIARAIAQDTPWIILDEPISHLDIKHQYEVMECLRKRNQEKGTTVLAILHDLNMTAQYCDEVIIMNQGSIVKKGPVDEVMTREILSDVYEINFHIERNAESGKLFIMGLMRD